MQHLLCLVDVNHPKYGEFEAGKIYDVLPHVATRLKAKYKKSFLNMPTKRKRDLPPRLQQRVNDINRQELGGHTR